MAKIRPMRAPREGHALTGRSGMTAPRGALGPSARHTTATELVAELFESTGSQLSPGGMETVLRSAIVAPADAVTVTTIVTLKLPLFATLSAALFGLQTTSPTPPTAGVVHFTPVADQVALLNVVPSGIASVRVTLDALNGPLFAAVAV